MAKSRRNRIAPAKPLLISGEGDVLREQRPLIDQTRFWAKVDRSGGADACWRWMGSVTPGNGYGQISSPSPLTGRKTMRAAHRCALEIATGTVLPPEVRVLHARGCAKTCVNPRHLRPGSPAENSADAKAEGVMTGRRLDAERVLKLVALHEAGHSRQALSERFGVSLTTIKSVISGKSWSSTTGIKCIKRKPGRPRRKTPTAKLTMAQRRARVLEALP